MYETFYNLQGKPFSLTPDTRFFFGTGGHKRVLAFLRYGIYQSEGFIVVTGDVGTGKTTLIHTLLEELVDQKDIVVAHLATTQRDTDDLLPMVNAAFGLSHQGLSKATLFQQLEQFFRDQTQKGRRAVLIVDEAQNLSMQALEALRLLVNFQFHHKALLQGFLVGQVEFRSMLRSESLEHLRQRIIASCHLGPLNIDETTQYIQHRLAVVGWNADPNFTPEAYSAIYDYTGGVPRRINTLCDRTLLAAYLEECHEITEQLICTVTKELDEESFGTIIHTRETPISKADALSIADPLSVMQVNALQNRSVIEKWLLCLTERLDTLEEAIVASGILENGLSASSPQELKKLQIQLAKTQTDKNQLEEKLAIQTGSRKKNSTKAVGED